ncbi:hypothetical protein [Kineococcus glutinatus]|uniref:Uncharacterized protein n=1 Tax=Kineococcus glutinatus TaxID=1070872 RepID=A0ABP8VDQ0_9ACTN
MRTSTSPARAPRRLLRAGAALSLAALGLAVAAAPASAARHDSCATARAVFRAQMNEARFWLNAADTLAAGGNTASAAAATAEAEYYMGLANESLGEMEGC